MSSVAIGIDLGTTFTAAAVYRDGQTEIIPNKEGDHLTPSVVFYHPNSPLEASVGKTANRFSTLRPRNYMIDMKRIIGRNYFDVYVQNFITSQTSKNFSLQIKNGPNNVPCIQLDTLDKKLNCNVTAEEVSSKILLYIKESAEVYLGCNVSEAVISVPAYFSPAQKAATKRAAEKVGFKVLKLITEPVAAAIYYTFGKVRNDANLLMFDLGGGTLDVSVIKYTKDKFEVKSIEGDMFLGGRDFDDVLFEYLRDNIGKSFGTSLIDPSTTGGLRFLNRLRKQAVNYKHLLSTIESCSISIDIDMEKEIVIPITRKLFEELSEPLYERIMYKVTKCLSSAKLSVTDIDKVVLVGGSTRMPKLKNLLSDMFSGIELSTDLNPDEAVAQGSSIHAALLKDNIKALERYRVKDVAPFSLGILAKYDLMVIFIKKGDHLPISSKQIMETSENDQRSVIFKIYEGEKKNGKYNKKLGDFQICNLPRGQAGEVKFEVMFSLDENGLLSVSAVEQSTNKAKQLEIKMDELTLCDTYSFVSLEYDENLNKEDILYDEFYRLRLVVDSYCNGILYEVDKPNLRTKKDIIVKELDKFVRTVDNLNFRNIGVLKEEFEKLRLKVCKLKDQQELM